MLKILGIDVAPEILCGLSLVSLHTELDKFALALSRNQSSVRRDFLFIRFTW